jgi:hypothetical protein
VSDEGTSSVTDDTGRGSAAGAAGEAPKRKTRAAAGQTASAGAGSRAPSSSGGPARPVETPPVDLDALAPRDGIRRLTGGVVLLEALALGAATLFLVVELFRDKPTETGGAIAQALITLVIGLGLLQLGRLILRADERARVPVLVWQALQASLGVPAWSTNRAAAVVLLAAAVIGGVGVLVPGVLRPDVRGLGQS